MQLFRLLKCVLPLVCLSACFGDIRTSLENLEDLSFVDLVSQLTQGGYGSELDLGMLNFADADIKVVEDKFPSNQVPAKEWTIVIYMQADNSLSEMAEFNVREIQQKVGDCPEINILVQWDKPETHMTHRLKIENGRIMDVGSLSQEMGVDPARELEDCMRWVADKFPAKRYALILWNHGGGIIEKSPGSNWLRPVGYATAARKAMPMSNEITGNRLEDEKGILYDDTQGTFLSNQDMSIALRHIKSFLGQEIDLIGMDACLMGGIEVAYSVCDSCKIMVASENLEPGRGWNYAKFLTQLVQRQGHMEARELGQAIVEAYQSFYEGVDPGFTQAMIDLSELDILKDYFNQMCIDLLRLKSGRFEMVYRLLNYAWGNTNSKFKDNYLDLRHFCDNLQQSCLSHMLSYLKCYDSAEVVKIVEELTALHRDLGLVKAQIQRAVLRSVTGSKFDSSGGLSFYFPDIWQFQSNVSYDQCLFAKKTLWPQVLHMQSRFEDIDDMPEVA